jgi:N-acyl amino acid synthase of PEP-CTERM/exosortase system
MIQEEASLPLGPVRNATSDILAERELFHEHFQVVQADTPALRREAYRLRYRVYCEENAYEDPANFPDGLESDAFDERSLHALVLHRATGMAVATTRLVLPDWGDPHGPFPVERCCAASLQRASVHLQPIDRARVAEVSRFAVSKVLRQHIAEGMGGASAVRGANGAANATLDMNRFDRILYFQITLSLVASAIGISLRQGITHWYAVMEPGLLRLLSRLGIVFTGVGPATDFHGRRHACVACLDRMLEGARRTRPEVHQALFDCRLVAGSTLAPAVSDAAAA